MIVLITYEDDGVKVSHGVDSKTFETILFPHVHPELVGGFFNFFVGWHIP